MWECSLVTTWYFLSCRSWTWIIARLLRMTSFGKFQMERLIRISSVEPWQHVILIFQRPPSHLTPCPTFQIFENPKQLSINVEDCRCVRQRDVDASPRAATPKLSKVSLGDGLPQTRAHQSAPYHDQITSRMGAILRSDTTSHEGYFVSGSLEGRVQ